MDVDNWSKIATTAREIYTLLKAMGADAKWAYDKWSQTDSDRFKAVFLDDIHDKTKEICTIYFKDFESMTEELSKEGFIDMTPHVAKRLMARMENSWFLKNEVRECAKAWLEHLPRSSKERAYVWSVCNVFYGYTRPDAKYDLLLSHADDIADSRKDSVLDTPNTRIANQIRTGEIEGRKEILSAIEKEMEEMHGRYKLSESAYQKLKIQA